MTREEFIQRLVVDAMADDFENVDQVILRDVAATAARCGMTVQRSDVVDALRALVGAGLAKAYDLSRSRESRKLPGMPPLDTVEVDFKTYFYLTEAGMEFHEADGGWWPFDDDGTLRPDWSPIDP